MKKFSEITDEQWNLIQELMNWDPPLERGSPRSNLRKVWNSIFYILSHGCRWIDLPKDPVKKTVFLGDELGFTAKEMGQLKQAGKLEATVTEIYEHLSLHLL